MFKYNCTKRNLYYNKVIALHFEKGYGHSHSRNMMAKVRCVQSYAQPSTNVLNLSASVKRSS